MDRLLFDFCTSDRPVATAPPVLISASWVPASYVLPSFPAPTGLGFKKLSNGVLIFVSAVTGFTYFFESAPDVAGAPGAWSQIASGIIAGRFTDNAATGLGAWYRVRAQNSNGLYSAYTAPQFFTRIDQLLSNTVVVNSSGQITGFAQVDGEASGIFNFLSTAFSIAAASGSYAGSTVLSYNAFLNTFNYSAPVNGIAFTINYSICQLTERGLTIKGDGPNASYAEMGTAIGIGVFFKDAEPSGSGSNNKQWKRLGLSSGGGLEFNDMVTPDSASYSVVRTLWHSVNFNPELKADLVSPWFSGLPLFTGGQVANGVIANAAGSLGGLQVISSGIAPNAGAAFMSFHRPGAFATYLGFDTDNQLKIGGWSLGAASYKVWSEYNDGAGSGCDADLLDGRQGINYAYSEQLTRTQLHNNTTLASGIYQNFGEGLGNAANSGIALTDWWHVINMQHRDMNGYNSQIACELSAGGTNNVHVRGSSSGFWREWSKLGFANIPKNIAGFVTGEVFVTSSNFTIGAGSPAGATYAIYNDSGAAITAIQGAGLTLRVAGTAITGNYVIPQRGWITIWFNSTSECIIL